VHNIVGNNKIFSDNIQNYSTNPYRRVDRSAQLAHGVNVHDAIKRLKESLARIPNVITTPAPDVEVIDFTPLGPVLAVRPYTHTSHYWQVYFDTNKAITDTFGAAAYPVPEAHYHINRGCPGDESVAACNRGRRADRQLRADAGFAGATHRDLLESR
jgi:small conductance mechanosensitive channel